VYSSQSNAVGKAGQSPEHDDKAHSMSGSLSRRTTFRAGITYKKDYSKPETYIDDDPLSKRETAIVTPAPAGLAISLNTTDLLNKRARDADRKRRYEIIKKEREQKAQEALKEREQKQQQALETFKGQKLVENIERRESRDPQNSNHKQESGFSSDEDMEDDEMGTINLID
jgi:hypothetical protein